MSSTLFHYSLCAVYRVTDWSRIGVADGVLIAFNALEALVWLGCAGYVARRTWRAHHSLHEYVYAALFVLFGVSDIIEVFQLSSALVWAKLAILIALFIVRARVRAAYTPRPRLV